MSVSGMCDSGFKLLAHPAQFVDRLTFMRSGVCLVLVPVHDIASVACGPDRLRGDDGDVYDQKPPYA